MFFHGRKKQMFAGKSMLLSCKTIGFVRQTCFSGNESLRFHIFSAHFPKNQFLFRRKTLTSFCRVFSNIQFAVFYEKEIRNRLI